MLTFNNDDLLECCQDYIGENETGLILHHDYNGVEVCQKYLNSETTEKEIIALLKFFGIYYSISF